MIAECVKILNPYFTFLTSEELQTFITYSFSEDTLSDFQIDLEK